MDDLKQFAAIAHQVSRDKGFYDDGVPHVDSFLSRTHSELSEALECTRDDKDLSATWVRDDGKPEGFVVELADVIIRIVDYVEALGLTDDLIDAMELKVSYNSTRPHKHGRKS